MEKWAERIKTLLDSERSLTQTGLAKACGISQPSVSQWFGTGGKPPTQMIMGDNLLAAARYLNTTPEWIIYGKTAAQSQHLMLDSEMMKSAIVSVKEALSQFGLELDAYLAAPMIAYAYAERVRLPRALSRAEYDAFDATIRDKLSGEVGDAGRAGRASKAGTGSDEAAASDPPKARRRAAGR